MAAKHVSCELQIYHMRQKLHHLIFAIALLKLHLLRQFVAYIYFNKCPVADVFYILYIIRDGEPVCFKISGPAYRANTTIDRAALLRDAGLQQRPTCDFITFRTLVLKLQNLGSATGGIC